MSNCPVCGNSETSCKDSRPKEYGGEPSIRRRRHCMQCQTRYSTYELTEDFLDDQLFKMRKPTMEKIEKINKLMLQIYAIIKE